MSNENKTNAKEITFESALQQLEAIVESLENGNIPLAELVTKFEEGTRYLKVCQKQLKDAELKIEKLKENEDSTDLFQLKE